MKQRVRKALLLVNTLGAVGYLMMVLAWTLFVAAILLLLMQSSVATLPAEITTSGAQPQTSADSMMLTQILAYGITAVMVVVMIAILVLIPYMAGKWGAHVMRYLLKWCRVPLTRRHLFLAKGLAVMVPLIGFIGINIGYQPVDMTIPAVHITTIFVSLFSLAAFLLQLIVARSRNVDVKDMW